MFSLSHLPASGRPGEAPVTGRHNVLDAQAFDDDSLATWIDPHGPGVVRIHSATSDVDDWHRSDQPESDGAALLDAVHAGLLWVNVVDVGRRSPQLAQIFDEMLADLSPHGVDEVFGNLLVSSPNASVHYHVDPEPNLLVQLRGHKTIWLYPALDSRFCSPEQLAAICSGTVEEEVPYDPSFDAHATRLDLAPGDVVSWAQNSPHRVRNADEVNVTLSISWGNPAVRRQIAAYAARHYFGKPLQQWITGAAPADRARAFSFKVARRLRVLPR